MPKIPEGGYQPSQEEMKGAEEHMVRAQSIFSERRENILLDKDKINEALSELGVEGSLKIETVGHQGASFPVLGIKGTLNGHHVRFYNALDARFRGSIDGIEIPYETQIKLFKRFSKLSGESDNVNYQQERLDEDVEKSRQTISYELEVAANLEQMQKEAKGRSKEEVAMDIAKELLGEKAT